MYSHFAISGWTIAASSRLVRPSCLGLSSLAVCRSIASMVVDTSLQHGFLTLVSLFSHFAVCRMPGSVQRDLDAHQQSTHTCCKTHSLPMHLRSWRNSP